MSYKYLIGYTWPYQVSIRPTQPYKVFIHPTRCYSYLIRRNMVPDPGDLRTSDGRMDGQTESSFIR